MMHGKYPIQIPIEYHEKKMRHFEKWNIDKYPLGILKKNDTKHFEK